MGRSSLNHSYQIHNTEMFSEVTSEGEQARGRSPQNKPYFTVPVVNAVGENKINLLCFVLFCIFLQFIHPSSQHLVFL
jgi:hypothetical protein